MLGTFQITAKPPFRIPVQKDLYFDFFTMI